MENVKVVVVGEGASGKTSLLITYTTNQFPNAYIPTVFDNYVANVYILQRLFMFGLWDTAGQEDYDRLRPLSYSDTDCFLVCFSVDSPSAFEQIPNKWIPEIGHFCPGTPFFIVGLKTDLRNDEGTIKFLKGRPVLKQDGIAMAKKVGAYGYVECSALTYDGVQNVFEEVAKCVLEKRGRKKKQCVLQ